MARGKKIKMPQCVCGWVNSFTETEETSGENRRILSLSEYLQVAGLLVLGCGVSNCRKACMASSLNVERKMKRMRSYHNHIVLKIYIMYGGN